MHTVITTRGRWAPAAWRPSRLVSAAVLAIAGAAAVTALVVGEGDRGATLGSTPRVVDARPLIDPRASAERFHHRLDAIPLRTAQVNRRATATNAAPRFLHSHGQGYAPRTGGPVVAPPRTAVPLPARRLDGATDGPTQSRSTR